MALVLVVEDEWGIAKLLEDVLVDEGHRVIVASNGTHALEKFGNETPDLVLTDFMMSGMDGAALVNHLVADPELKHIPIIMMSSLPEAFVADRCSGYKRFVRKPFNIFEVIDVVANLLSCGSAEGVPR